ERLDLAADALALTPLGRMTVGDLQRWAVDFSASRVGPEGRAADCSAPCPPPELRAPPLPAQNSPPPDLPPLQGKRIAVACDAAWLPGGYPELHAAEIAANTGLRDDLAAHIAAGKPVWAECGGMMALFDTLAMADGQRHALWGLLAGEVTMQKRLAALGPQQLRLASGTLRGHTFHYSTTATALPAVARTSRPHTEPAHDAGEARWQQGAMRAS
ncbi:MAG: cobyrinic acid a,c-diamide synthase, partial [Burkholderiales bacterium PBB5]